MLSVYLMDFSAYLHYLYLMHGVLSHFSKGFIRELKIAHKFHTHPFLCVTEEELHAAPKSADDEDEQRRWFTVDEKS